MKCEDVAKELIAYLDRRSNSAERQEVENHLAGCAACRTRAEEYRKIWAVLEEVPVLEPSPGFDARVRQRVAAEPSPEWFGWLVPQPRLAFTLVLLVVLGVWFARLPQDNSASSGISAQVEPEQFQVIKDLGVLENYDVLSKFDALSELPPITRPQPAQTPDDQQKSNDGGDM